MNSITFSDEQAMLLETAADFCRNRSSREVVRSKLDADEVDHELWREMTALGWTGINIPEAYGGLGLDVSAVVPIVESMGRHLMGSPYTATIIAIEALETSGSHSQKSEWLPRLAEGAIGTLALTEPDGSWVLDELHATATRGKGVLRLGGTKCFVTDADAAAFVIVSVMLEGAARLVLVDRSQLPTTAMHRETVIDQTRRSFRLNLDGVEIPEEQLLEATDVAAIERASLLLLCAEMSGGLSGVLTVIVEYLKTRRAFDKLIGSYQALKHPTVDILLGLEAARSHLYHAATLVASGTPAEAELALRIAKAQSSETFAFAGDRAVQFHGGFGFTFECDAQLFLRRALWCQYQFGDEFYHRQLLAPLLLDQIAQESS